MANDINTVHLIGRLTRDPELKSTSGGTSVCELGLAVNTSRKDGSGGYEDRASFFDVSCFAGTADAVARYMAKGSQIAVMGRLEQQRWEKDGQKRSKVVVIANHVQFIGSQKDREQSGDVPIDERDLQTASSGVGISDDVIPF